MKMLSYRLLALLFALTLTVQAKDAATTVSYFDPATVDTPSLLPNPPADNSSTTKQEIDILLQKQAIRTPEEVARIKQEVHLNVWLFANVLGPWFTEANLPLTAALFENVQENIRPVVDAAKKHWNRPRPYELNAAIHPPIELPKNAAYPSGHSTFGNTEGLILAELVPDQKDALLARGRQIGYDRVLAGVHYPSDVVAGRKLAHDLFAKFMASPAFQADLAKAKAEIAAARQKH